MAANAAMKSETTAPRQAKLFDRIGTYFDGRHANGRDGLVLLDECIRRVASKDRDWDALARFVTRSGASNSGAKVKKIIRAAFGNALTYKVDKKHKAGGTFVLSWDGPFNLVGSNTYGAVRKAIADSKSWDDKDFLAALSKIVPDAPKAERVVSEESLTKVVKHLESYFDARVAEGFSSGEIMEKLAKALAAKRVNGVAKKVVNGITITEIGF